MTRVSVIMPTYNKAGYLDRTLASFEAQTLRDFEIVVLDDGSTDHTQEVLERYRGRLPLTTERRKNWGRSAARNGALGLATGEWLVFSDDDRIVTPEFLAEHLRLLESGAGDVMVLGKQRGLLVHWRADLPLQPRVACELAAREHLRAALLAADGRDLFSPDDVRERLAEVVERYSFPERWWEESCVPHIRRCGESLDDSAMPWALGTTGNMSVSRRHVIDVGGFDEKFRGWGLEDLDLCYRLHHHGVRSRIGPHAVSYHQAHPTAGKRSDWLENLLYFVRKYDRLDVAFYGILFTSLGDSDLAAEGPRLRALEAARDGAMKSALREAYLKIAELRVRSLDWSGARHTLAADQDDW